MTTEAAERQYEADYLYSMRGKENAVHNPHGKPVEDLPFIFGFNNGGSTSFLCAQLVSQDGHALGSHGCSSEAYMVGDLGILEGTRPDRHEKFQKHYPEGYRMLFVQSSEIAGCELLQEAFKLNIVIGKAAEEAECGK